MKKVIENADVSVVMPHYNALPTVERSIRSIIDQTHPVRQLVIVDDHSSATDSLIQIVEKYSKQLDIVLVLLNKNSGAAVARNVGVSKATCKYIAFLDSDDVWHPKKIALQYQYMETHPVMLTGHGYIFNLYHKNFADTITCGAIRISPLRFLRGNPLYTPTVMARRKSFVPFDGRHNRLEDYKCWFENTLKCDSAMLTCDLAGGYKPPIGSSGLSGSVQLMHSSYLAVLRHLHADKKINFAFYFVALAIETIKYPLRLARVWVQKNIRTRNNQD
ncbi:glycosyltransferase family 2 protein [Allopusillimonas ginsengisoli]|uniref:glycosyltransferase family 2 protein n=1 Tax=Allopusillimonas ginsengisoli TaxID=453575 RepID=UPI0039C1F53C